MSTINTKEYFSNLSENFQSRCKEKGYAFDSIQMYYSAETSEFCRFNNSKIRQPGEIKQCDVNIKTQSGKKTCVYDLSLSYNMEPDMQDLMRAADKMSDTLKSIPDDPYFFPCQKNESLLSDTITPTMDNRGMVEDVLKTTKNADLVGILTSGTMVDAYWNSLGQYCYHASESYNLDYSLYAGTEGELRDKAISKQFGGSHWNTAALQEHMEESFSEVVNFKNKPISIKPGKYKAYLSPEAVDALMGMLSYGGFSARANRTKSSPALKFHEGKVSLNDMITLEENYKELSNGQRFSTEGFSKPEVLPLIGNGRYLNELVSPLSAKEFKLETNGAGISEIPDALSMKAGTLAKEDILKELGEGIFIGNLHYLNVSDRNNCRFTGLTRFGTFWVEGGKLKAPINVMRFDDSLYDIFGGNLCNLTEDREVIAETYTYGRRSRDQSIMPGALVNDFTLTL